jgi:type VI secretion system secreted protein Hcp
MLPGTLERKMALDMFINMGDTIKGESADSVQGAKGDIDVLAWSWGMSQSGTTHMGKGGGAGKANFQDLSFTKYVDSSSNALMIALAKGTHITKCTLLARKAGEGQKRYIEIAMDEVMVTSVSTGGSGGEDRLTENITLNFAKVKFSYAPQKAEGGVDADKDFAWDIAGNVASS